MKKQLGIVLTLCALFMAAGCNHSNNNGGENNNPQKIEFLKPFIGDYKSTEGNHEIKITEDTVTYQNHVYNLNDIHFMEEMNENEVLFKRKYYKNESHDEYIFLNGKIYKNKYYYSECNFLDINEIDNPESFDNQKHYFMTVYFEDTSDLSSYGFHFSSDDDLVIKINESDYIVLSQGSSGSIYVKIESFTTTETTFKQTDSLGYGIVKRAWISSGNRDYHGWHYDSYMESYYFKDEKARLINEYGKENCVELYETLREPEERIIQTLESTQCETIYFEKVESNAGNADDDDDSGDDSISASDFEGYTWKYVHENVNSTTTQNIVFDNGTVTVTTITNSNSSNTSNQNRKETASYTFSGNKITITYSKAGYNITADFKVSIDGNSLTLNGEENASNAISLLGTLFQYGSESGTMVITKD